MKILIAVPTFETIQPEVFKAIYNLKSEHDLSFDFVRGYDCAKARNDIARRAMAGCFDYVLMVDSDTLIPEDTLDLMLDPPADVVLGVCPRKNTKEGKTAIIKFGGPGYHDSYYYSDLPEDRVRVKGGGFACALIKTSIFSKLDMPWFQYAQNADGSALSEDFYFCQMANFYGVEILMDPRVKCGHLARYYQYE
ncbi:MAG: hypothetical protein IIY28_01510 [Lachnospiraceae bacterium]|nr:hypothetical protein [Lachnospiraceae bacterium]